jgi:hypothetical protein
MAKNAKASSFIHEFGLVTGPKEVRILDVRFDAGRNLYNTSIAVRTPLL